MAIILITGGSGLIGRRLSSALLANGHEVRWLSRRPGSAGGIRAFAWDAASGTLDTQALRGVHGIVHLAGAGIADKRWTKARVAALIASRTATARLLLHQAQTHGTLPECFVSAAGIGYYGAVTRDAPFTEDEGPGRDTIARISAEWERAVDAWGPHCRVVKLRTPVVLAREGGALPKLAAPARWGLAAPVGSGRQWMPWVHIDDLVEAYAQALFSTRWHGSLNIAGGNATNREVARAIARALHRPAFLPAVPAFLLRAALGEMANILLEGSPVSAARARALGFDPHWTDLDAALRHELGVR